MVQRISARLGDRGAGTVEGQLAGDRLVHQHDGDEHHGSGDARCDEADDAKSILVSHDTCPYPLADSHSKHSLPEFFVSCFPAETLRSICCRTATLEPEHNAGGVAKPQRLGVAQATPGATRSLL